MFSSSAVWTLVGITRNTAAGPFRSRSTLARNRARSRISYAKSVSLVSANSFLLRSGMMEKSSASISAMVSASMSGRRCISPCLRIRGGSPTRRCRSEEPDFTSVWRKPWIRSSAADDASAVAAVGAGRRGAGAASAAGAAIRASIGIEMAALERRGFAGPMVTVTSSPAWAISTSTRLPSTA